jgi:2-polyprenyl-3-methyl-5-hydroxy-6-metoxy-1,4-benzoquinol methylase
MHYKVAGHKIRSENAAKPISQVSQPLLKWIESQKKVDEALDFGCGKLRYAGALAKRAARLTLVDSEVQLSRIQKIGDEITTVREYAASHWSNSRVLSIEEFESDTVKYNLILCANVLSAIPSTKVRSKVLRRLSSALCPTGRCLLVTQYRNSYFDEMAKSPNARPFLDGWLLVTPRMTSYYGIIPKQKLEALVTRHGFSVFESWIDRQSAYVLAQRAERA